MGGPRKRSIRRRIAANNARGTATSASWNTRYRPWRTIRAPTLTSFSRKVVSDQCERGELRANADLALLVLDPLQCFVHADVNADPQAAAITMSLLNTLAAETGATVLATHHVRKDREAPKNGAEARASIRGSSALVDQSRVAIVLWAPDEPDVRKACKILGADYAPNAIAHGAVVKSNNGADRSTGPYSVGRPACCAMSPARSRPGAAAGTSIWPRS